MALGMAQKLLIPPVFFKAQRIILCNGPSLCRPGWFLAQQNIRGLFPLPLPRSSIAATEPASLASRVRISPPQSASATLVGSGGRQWHRHAVGRLRDWPPCMAARRPKWTSPKAAMTWPPGPNRWRAETRARLCGRRHGGPSSLLRLIGQFCSTPS
jgi:hypothetical protein